MKSILLLCFVVCTTSAMPQKLAPPEKVVPDAAWARDYATTQQDIKWDPHFIPMLRRALPQHQWFWRDHYRFLPLPELVRLYIGVPGTVTLDEDRYASADGCVPHVCTIRAMLWIDTVARPPKVVFVTTESVDSSAGAQPVNHLLLFSSFRLDDQQLPKPLLHSIQHWIDSRPSTNRKDLDVLDSRYNIVIATIVQPTGVMLDLSPELLHLEGKTQEQE